MRGIKFRWRYFFIAWLVVYGFFVIPHWLLSLYNDFRKENISQQNEEVSLILKEDRDRSFEFALKYRGEELFISDILAGEGAPSLQERLQPPITGVTKKKIFSNSGFQAPNLGGCSDWNCEITSNPSEADALINHEGSATIPPNESPVNYYVKTSHRNYNMSIGFRHDSPVASPYGYTVKLSKSRPLKLNVTLISGKNKGAAWFVSHCQTNSKREDIVEKLQRHFPVDKYGACSGLKCPKGGKCEDAIDTDYHFYLALENSICQDYTTEKLWNQGYSRVTVPVVLKRSVLERYAPPKSFIAFDDFKSLKDMGMYLDYLTKNKTAYMEYFEWKKDYEVIYLNGLEHDAAERPWGICQLCRLLHQSPRPYHEIRDLPAYWKQTCENDGALADKLLAN